MDRGSEPLPLFLRVLVSTATHVLWLLTTLAYTAKFRECTDGSCAQVHHVIIGGAYIFLGLLAYVVEPLKQLDPLSTGNRFKFNLNPEPVHDATASATAKPPPTQANNATSPPLDRERWQGPMAAVRILARQFKTTYSTSSPAGPQGDSEALPPTHKWQGTMAAVKVLAKQLNATAATTDDDSPSAWRPGTPLPRLRLGSNTSAARLRQRLAGSSAAGAGGGGIAGAGGEAGGEEVEEKQENLCSSGENQGTQPRKGSWRQVFQWNPIL